MKKIGTEKRPHIGIFGRINTGKSSLINVLARQDISIVAKQRGTTTDPVKKVAELTGFGPCVLIDTAGIDDVSSLGKKRIQKTKNIINQIDIAILLITNNFFDIFEQKLIENFNKKSIPYFIVHNKSDISKLKKSLKSKLQNNVIDFSCKQKNIKKIVDLLNKNITHSYKSDGLLDGLVKKDDIVMLIMPIDSEAPEGRIILPQQKVLRDALDKNATSIVLQHTEIKKFIAKSKLKPKLAVTDSQMFEYVDKILPKDIPLTGFSLLLAHKKRHFAEYIKGTKKIDTLKSGDRVLILESCTHNVITCEDIGRNKIPRMLRAKTNKKLNFDIVCGLDPLPKNLKKYKLVIQCGGCVATKKQLENRLQDCVEAGIEISNYGMVIAYCTNVFKRITSPFN